MNVLIALRKSRWPLALLLMASLAGCKHKDKSTPPPPQAQAPTVAPEPQPVTPVEPPPTTPPATTEPAEKPPETPNPNPPKPPSKPRRSSGATTARKPPATTPAPGAPATNPPQPSSPATNSANPNPATSPSPNQPAIPMTPDVLQAQGSVEQLLQAAESNLKNIRRSLNPAEKNMLDQCRNYIQRARTAQTDGDTSLARNYAVKAHQLSTALASP